MRRGNRGLAGGWGVLLILQAARDHGRGAIVSYMMVQDVLLVRKQRVDRWWRLCFKLSTRILEHGTGIRWRSGPLCM